MNAAELCAAVKTRLDLVELIGRRVALEIRGRDHVGLCPFHNEKTPSFTVNASKVLFHCFGCGAHGDAIDFTMRSSGLSFVEAVKQLAEQVGLEVPMSDTGDTSSCTRLNNAENLPSATDKISPRRQTASNASFALDIWRQCQAAGGTLVETYLRSRGITIPPPASIRYSPYWISPSWPPPSDPSLEAPAQEKCCRDGGCR